MEVLVGILAALTTILIGWQIYAIIDLKNRVDNIVDDKMKNIAVQMQKYRCEAIGTAMYNIGEYEISNGHHNFAFKCMLRALCELYEENPQCVEIDMCFDNLQIIINELHKNGQRIALEKYAHRAMLASILNIDNDRKTPIVDFIINEVKTF